MSGGREESSCGGCEVRCKRRAPQARHNPQQDLECCRKSGACLNGTSPARHQAQNRKERFHSGNTPLELTVFDFWQWTASDLVSNATRGLLAEFIVASALGVATNVREEWRAFDLLTATGTKIEVKSAAYLQSWAQNKQSEIIFSVRPTRAWDADTNVLSTEIKRQADVYVFALLAHRDKRTLNPLDLDQWEFYVVPTSLARFAKTTSVGQ